MPFLDIPLHTVLELHISAHGCKVEQVALTGDVEPNSSMVTDMQMGEVTGDVSARAHGG